MAFRPPTGLLTTLIVSGLTTLTTLLVTGQAVFQGNAFFQTAQVTSTLTLVQQGAGRLLFTDASKAVSSTSRVAVDGDLGKVSATSVTVGDGSSGAPSFSFAGNSADGLWLNATNYPQLKGTTGAQIYAGGSLYQYNGSAFYPDTHNARTLGDSTHHWSTIFGTIVSSTSLIASNASSTFFLSGASALVSTVAPIPTSTSFLAGTIPNQLYLFNATNTNCIYWTPGQLRGSWTGGVLTPVVSWIPAATGTGDVVWRFAARSLADNTYVGAAFAGPFSYATSTVGNNLTRQIENMDTVAVESAASGVPIRFEACRMGAQAGDTFGGDAYLELIKGEYNTPNYSD